jgi:hypothetical protein
VPLVSAPIMERMSITCVPGTQGDIASTQARSGDRSILTEPVAAYVEQNGLYSA